MEMQRSDSLVFGEQLLVGFVERKQISLVLLDEELRVLTVGLTELFELRFEAFLKRLIFGRQPTNLLFALDILAEEFSLPLLRLFVVALQLLAQLSDHF